MLKSPKLNNYIKVLSVIMCAIIPIFSLSSTNATRTERSHRFTRYITHTSVEDPEYFEERFRHLSLNILELDSSRVQTHVTAPNHSATGLEMLVDQANRLREQGHNIVGGINGDMFAMHSFGVAEGQPSSLTVIDGEIITMHSTFEESRALPVFATDNVDDNEPYFGHLMLHGTATAYRDGEFLRNLRIDQFNRNYYLANWHVAMFTPRISPNGNIEILSIDVEEYSGVHNLHQWEFAVVELDDGNDKIVAGQQFRGTLTEVVVGVEDAHVPEGAVVFAGFNFMRNQQLRIGDEIEFELNIYNTPEDFHDDLGEPQNHFTEIIGAYNWLVRDGIVQDEDDWISVGLPVDWLITSTPARTGIGIREDGTILAVTVDQVFGRAEGMTMAELAELFYELGAVQALNFDGGSSTEMIALDQNHEFVTLNTPTGLDPRPVSTSVLFSSNSESIRGFGHSMTNEIILWVLFSSLAVLAASSVALGIVKLIKRKKS